MMLTREQAAATWCPMVRSVKGGSNCDPQHGTRHPFDANCIADQCAMWRWVLKPRKFNAGMGCTEHVESTHGYCGLAGAPVIAGGAQ